MSNPKDGNKNPNPDDDSSRKRKNATTGPENPKKSIKSYFTSNGKLLAFSIVKIYENEIYPKSKENDCYI